MSCTGSSSKGRIIGGSSIPPTSKKLVDNLKEVVNCSEHEIYAMLRECDMNPDDAVNRLLNQDPFHEVKSKKEKKKENKDRIDSKSRRVHISSNRGGRCGNDHHLGCSGPFQAISSDTGVVRGKLLEKKGNGGVLSSSTLFATEIFGDVPCGGLVCASDSVSSDASRQLLYPINDKVLPLQVSEHHSAWVGVPGHVSLADIVKRGASTVSGELSSLSSSNFHGESHLYQNSEPNIGATSEAVFTVENLADDSFNPHGHGFECGKGEREDSNVYDSGPDELSSVEDVTITVSSTASNLQLLKLHKEEFDLPSATEDPVVVIGNHVKVQMADCTNLSFGSFGSSVNDAFSRPIPSGSMSSNVDMSNVVTATSHVEHLNIHEYHRNGRQKSVSEEGIQELPCSHADTFMHNTPSEPLHGHQYHFPMSCPGYGIQDVSQGNTVSYSFALTNSQLQSLEPFSSGVPYYSNSLPTSEAASTVQAGRESDIAYSPFLVGRMLPVTCSPSVSSITVTTLSMPEATSQTLPSANVVTDPKQPQHIPTHAYSPASPMGQFGNIISYPFLPTSYTYMPYSPAGSSVVHQSLLQNPAGINYSVPQYKISASQSNIDHSAAVSSGFRTSSTLPGMFNSNQSPCLISTTAGFGDVMSSQYKDSFHYAALHQNEGLAPWGCGSSSRMVSSVPASTFYSFQGRSQTSGFRQVQQPLPYGAHGYPNMFHSQAASFQERHHQTASGGNIDTSQRSSSHQSHSMWQNNY